MMAAIANQASAGSFEATESEQSSTLRPYRRINQNVREWLGSYFSSIRSPASRLYYNVASAALVAPYAYTRQKYIIKDPISFLYCHFEREKAPVVLKHRQYCQRVYSVQLMAYVYARSLPT